MMPSTSANPPDAAARWRKRPRVAIVGRANVGKSTLFNRLVGERRAIVDDLPGVTRDRNYAEARWAERRFVVVDTGGLERQGGSTLEDNVQAQTRRAVAEADLVIFLFDGKSGLNPADEEAVDLLRRSQKPVFFAVNKLDSQRRAENLYEFHALGIAELYPISAEHGLGIAELLDAAIECLPEYADNENEETPENKTAPLRVAIVGRPNVGKSTLINRLLGYERSLVDAKPGTTRDALDTPFELGGETCLLIDTAGIRRKARIDDRIEQFSVKRSLRAVEQGDLIILVIDGPEGATDQDAQILRYAIQRGKALLLSVNKWDLISKDAKSAERYREEIRYRLPFLEFAPVALISAMTGFGVRKLTETAAQILRAYRRKVSTSAVNQALQKIVRAHSPPLVRNRPVKFFYATQTGTRPPTFAIFVNRPDAVAASYKKYLMHELQQGLGFEQTPIRLDLRARREEKSGKRS